MHMTYRETVQYLYQSLPMFQRVGASAYKKDLTNTLALCEVLGNPHNKFKSIHVAGTNGKGSCSHMLAAVLQSAGYKTGLYTSPHLKEFTERIRVNGIEVEKDFVVDFVQRIKPAIEKIQPSFFEITVVMAFDYFARQAVDVAVVEVGLGGRLDSTNVIHPVLSLITNISWDHMDLLGNSLQLIASEKAGIIKPGVPVVISERQTEVEDVFLSKARECGSKLIFAADEVQLVKQNGNQITVRQHDYVTTYSLELTGIYQQKNLPGVLTCLNELKRLHFLVDEEHIRAGLSKAASVTGLKGRWQTINDHPLTICDTAHNEAGIGEVVRQIQSTPHKSLRMVWGMVKDKEVLKILGQLPRHAAYYFCEASIPRALPAVELKAQAEAAGLKGEVVTDVNEAIAKARKESDPDDLVFVGGSTFVVAEINNL
jgi:dihydrofolate synthase / folylpolyglutamate synthase